jgi:hypothetical protein
MPKTKLKKSPVTLAVATLFALVGLALALVMVKQSMDIKSDASGLPIDVNSTNKGVNTTGKGSLFIGNKGIKNKDGVRSYTEEQLNNLEYMRDGNEQEKEIWIRECVKNGGKRSECEKQFNGIKKDNICKSGCATMQHPDLCYPVCMAGGKYEE